MLIIDKSMQKITSNFMHISNQYLTLLNCDIIKSQISRTNIINFETINCIKMLVIS